MQLIDFKLFIIERIRKAFDDIIKDFNHDGMITYALHSEGERDGMIEKVKLAKDVRDVTVIVGSFFEGHVEGMLIDFIERDIT